MIERAINHCDKAPNGGVTQPVLTGRQGDAPTGQMDTYVYRENNLPVDILDPSSLSFLSFFVLGSTVFPAVKNSCVFFFPVLFFVCILFNYLPASGY